MYDTCVNHAIQGVTVHGENTPVLGCYGRFVRLLGKKSQKKLDSVTKNRFNEL